MKALFKIAGIVLMLCVLAFGLSNAINGTSKLIVYNEQYDLYECDVVGYLENINDYLNESQEILEDYLPPQDYNDTGNSLKSIANILIMTTNVFGFTASVAVIILDGVMALIGIDTYDHWLLNLPRLLTNIKVPYIEIIQEEEATN